MAFFKEDNSIHNKRLKRVENLVWVLIYGGLLVFITGHFVAAEDVALARTMGLIGMVAVAAGVVLIFVRSRMRGKDEPPTKNGDTQ